MSDCRGACGSLVLPFIELFYQLLVKDFIIDSITVTPKQKTLAPGINYMTDFDEWLFIQVRQQWK